MALMRGRFYGELSLADQGCVFDGWALFESSKNRPFIVAISKKPNDGGACNAEKNEGIGIRQPAGQSQKLIDQTCQD